MQLMGRYRECRSGDGRPGQLEFNMVLVLRGKLQNACYGQPEIVAENEIQTTLRLRADGRWWLGPNSGVLP